MRSLPRWAGADREAPAETEIVLRMIGLVSPVVWVMAMLLPVGPAVAGIPGQGPPGTLAHAATIDGIFLPAGTIVTGHDANGHLSFTLRKRFRINGWMLPADTAVIRTNPGIVQYVLGAPAMLAGVPFESVVTFQYGKLEGKFALSRNAVIGGIPCAADAEVYFHSGLVQECDLTRPLTFHGIPCAAGDFGYADGNVDCTLASTYRRSGYVWAEQTHVVLGEKKSSFTTGPKPPDLRVFGRPLPDQTEVDFDGDDIRIHFEPPVPYRGCHVVDLAFTSGRAGDVTSTEDSEACVMLSVPRSELSTAPAPGRRR